MRIQRLARVCLAAALGIALGCDDMSHSRFPPSKVFQPIERELHISGPALLEPGTTGQFVAVVRYDDGSSLDVTTTVGWRSSSPTSLAIGAGGLATGGTRGGADVTASLPKLTSHPLNVAVLESGLFRLTGKVTTSGLPVSGALVEVIGGIGAGLQAVTGPSYALYGLAGDVEIRVSADGFHSQTRIVSVRDDSTGDFDLQPTNAPVAVAGFYRLTIAAAPACRDRLPEGLRERRFDVIISDDHPGISMTFKSSTLIETHGEFVFSATLVGRALQVELDPLQENLSDGLFALIGTLHAMVADTETRGTFDGKFAWYGGRRFGVIPSCHDAGHTMRLRRQ